MTEPAAIFKTPQGEARSWAAYDAVLKKWPVPYESLNLNTRFGQTHYLVCGPEIGKPIILLHGQEASATMWLSNIETLSQTRRVFALDTVGDIGKSKPIRLPENRADYAAWLLDILDQLGLDQAALIGISYGGFLALNFALAYPRRVSHIALLAPGIPNFGPPTFRWAFYGLPMLMVPSRFTIKRFIKAASQTGYSAQDPVHEQMVVAVPQLRNRTFLRPQFLDEELSQLSAPCLLLIGDHEIMYEPGEAAARACQLIPNLTAKLISNAGHMLNSDQPGTVNNHLIRFLNELPNAGSAMKPPSTTSSRMG